MKMIQCSCTVYCTVYNKTIPTQPALREVLLYSGLETEIPNSVQYQYISGSNNFHYPDSTELHWPCTQLGMILQHFVLHLAYCIDAKNHSGNLTF